MLNESLFQSAFGNPHSAFSTFTCILSHMSAHAVLVTVSDRPGMLFGMTGVLANHQANITYVDMHGGGAVSDTYFEFTLPDDAAFETVRRDLRAVDGIVRVEETASLI